jgi:hypothetical protein
MLGGSAVKLGINRQNVPKGRIRDLLLICALR